MSDTLVQSTINQLVMSDLSQVAPPVSLMSGPGADMDLLRRSAIEASWSLPRSRGFVDLSLDTSGESLSGKVAFLPVDAERLSSSTGQALGDDLVNAFSRLTGAAAVVLVVDARQASADVALNALNVGQSRNLGDLCLPSNVSFHVVAGENDAVLSPEIMRRTRAIVLNEHGDCFLGNPPRSTRVAPEQMCGAHPVVPSVPPPSPRP